MTIAEMIVVAWCLAVAVTDLHARRIPNILTLGMCLVALCWLLVSGHSLLDTSIQSAMLGAAISLLLTLPAYAARLLGAGDVKLLLAIALVGGHYLMLFAFVMAALLAVGFGIAYLFIVRFRGHTITRRRWLPFGAALSVGLLVAVRIAT